jgi:hypothetical protein
MRTLVGYIRAARRGEGKGITKALLYLLVQSLSGWLGIVHFSLYIATAAVHYVEYHVLMYPRCFHTPLDPTSRLDAYYGRLRHRPLVFYTVVLGIAAIVTLLTRRGMGEILPTTSDPTQPIPFRVMISLFDGLFLFHFFVEAFIWRFSNPYFRKSMDGLYFPTRAKS